MKGRTNIKNKVHIDGNVVWIIQQENKHSTGIASGKILNLIDIKTAEYGNNVKHKEKSK